MATKPAKQNSEYSEQGSKLISVIMRLWKTPDMFEDEATPDMIAVLGNIVEQVVNGMTILNPELKSELSPNDFDIFKSWFMEAIGVGVRIHWAEFIFIKKRSHLDFHKQKGVHFQNYLLKGFDDYFGNMSKDPEPFTATCVKDAINYFGLMWFNEVLKSEKGMEIISQLSTIRNGTLLESVNLLSIYRAFIWNGYVMACMQEQLVQASLRKKGLA